MCSRTTPYINTVCSAALTKQAPHFAAWAPIPQTKKYLDEMLMDNVLGFLTAQQNASKPFYMFYAPHSIHT